MDILQEGDWFTLSLNREELEGVAAAAIFGNYKTIHDFCTALEEQTDVDLDGLLHGYESVFTEDGLFVDTEGKLAACMTIVKKEENL